MSDDLFEKLKQEFKQELEGITDIDELKEVYAGEIAKRDKLLLELQEKNQIILKTAFKQKKDDLDLQK